MGEVTQARPGVVLAHRQRCPTCIHIRRRKFPGGSNVSVRVCRICGIIGTGAWEFPQARPAVVLASRVSCGSSTCIHIRRGNVSAGLKPQCACLPDLQRWQYWGISAGQARCSPSQPLQLRCSYMHPHPHRNSPAGQRECACLPDLRHHRDRCLGNLRRPGQV